MLNATRTVVTGLVAVFALGGCTIFGQAVGSRPSPSPGQPTPVASLAGACKSGPHTASFARLKTSPPPRSSTPGAPGAISGHVSTPSEVIVPQLVYAVSTAGPEFGAFATETVFNQPTYVMRNVAPGTYYVYSTSRPVSCQAAGDVAGAIYSVAIKCGLTVNCNDHTPIAVTVVSGKTTSAIDPVDWYGPGIIPAPPKSIVPSDPALQTAEKSYPTARDAALAAAHQSHAERFAGSDESCPANVACFWLGSEVDGTNAAYFPGQAGSNGILMRCVTYVFHDSAGWHPLRSAFCAAKAFPAVGSTGYVYIGIGATGCVNVRNAPAGAKVGCVKADTRVTIDSGPVYKSFPKSDGLWWHVAGKGWMADDYLQSWW
jgi:hypothetical protein